MKKFLISTSIIFTWVVLNSQAVNSQTGNMSDVTMPNPIEVPQTPDNSEPPSTPSEPEPPSEPVVREPPAPDDSETPSEPVVQEPPEPDDSETPSEPVVQEPSTPSEPEPVVHEPSENPEEEPIVHEPVVEVHETPNHEDDVTNSDIPLEEVTPPIETDLESASPSVVQEKPEVKPTQIDESGGEKIGDETLNEGDNSEVTQQPDPESTEQNEASVVEESEAEIVQDEETTTTETTEKETSESKTEETAKESNVETKIDTQAYELQIQQSNVNMALLMQEESYATQIASYSDLEIYGDVPSVEEISQRLGELWEQTGKKAAFINVSLQKKQLESFTVLPSVPASLASTEISKNQIAQPKEIALRRTTKKTRRRDLLTTAKQFRQEISNPRKIHQNGYLESAQKLYQLIIEPIEAELEANDIDILVFAMDSGLRLLPISALHDGEQFLIEKYAVAMVPSFGLTDTRYVDTSQSSILAMGASRFKEQQASILPTMPIELGHITHNASRGEIYLNEDFTVDNFKAQNSSNKPFSIIHLGTHAAFNSGEFDNSYIQFYDEKLQLSALRDISDELGWGDSENPPIELLVLSACQTALGDEKAELGFAGLALQTGVKSALASLWYVSDLGTLALMGEFYDRLDDTLIKSEALRQTQLRMLTGQVSVKDRKIKLSDGNHLNLPPSVPKGSLTFAHPYFWSAFTLIGNWN